METRSTEEVATKHQIGVVNEKPALSDLPQVNGELHQKRTLVGLFGFCYPAELTNLGSIHNYAARYRRKFADIVLVSGSVVSFLVFVFCLYRFDWTTQNPISWKGLLLYHLLPASMSGLLFAALRLSVVYKFRLTIFGLAFLISVYGIEWFMDFSDSFLFGSDTAIWGISGAPQEKKNALVRLAQQSGTDFDTRDESQVVANLRAQGVDAVPFTMPELFETQPDKSLKSAFIANGSELVPIGRIANKTVVLCNESGQYVTYQSDKHGFNNPDEIWNSNQLEIAALGQSFTQGFCVPTEHNFVSLIGRDSGASLNLGHSGEGPLVALAAIIEYLRTSKPRRVLWFHIEGIDLPDLQVEARSPLLMRYLRQDFNQGLLDRQREIDLALRTALKRFSAEQLSRVSSGTDVTVDRIQAVAKLSTLRQKMGLVENKTGLEISAFDGVNMNLFREILSRAKAQIGAWGGQFYFIYLPSWARYATESYNADKERAAVLALVDALNIQVIDVHPAFRSQADPLDMFPFRRFGHYNENGHRLVAETVFRALQR